MTSGAAWGTLVLRVALGIIFVIHGYAAIAVVGPRALAGYTVRMGFPPGTAMPFAWYVILVHGLGGALLVLGLWTRAAAVLNIPVMLHTALAHEWPRGFFLKGVVVDTAADHIAAAGYEYAMLVLACTTTVALLGAGRFSIDDRRRAPGRRH